LRGRERSTTIVGDEAVPVLDRRQLGRTPIEVTALGFGAAPLGGLFSEVTDADAGAAVRAALAAGITYFDTAPLYGHGLSEHRLGEALRWVPRDRVVVSTKVGRLLRPLPAGRPQSGLFAAPLPFEWVFDYGYAGTIRSLEDSLQRLGLARVDVALIHDVVPRWQGDDYERRFHESMEGAYRALADLRRQGRVAAIGAGVKDAEVCLRYATAGDFDCFMLSGQYTLLDQNALPELLPHCARSGIAVLLASPFNSGILATGARPDARYVYEPAPPEVLERVRRLEQACGRHGVPLAAAALQFPLAHPALAAVVPGARSAAEVEANLALFRRPIPAALWQELKADGLLPAEAPVPQPREEGKA
jgi:D-threo-aldose 1-dehydrogenase